MAAFDNDRAGEQMAAQLGYPRERDPQSTGRTGTTICGSSGLLLRSALLEQERQQESKSRIGLGRR